MMKILIDISHPAHVHLFRNAYHEWCERGHEILITARAKDITTRLLDLYEIDYELVSLVRKGILGLAIGLLEHDWGVYQVAKKYKPDVMIGTSVAVAHVSKILPGKSIIFNEDNVDSSPIFAKIAYPFTDYIVTPVTLVDDLGEKNIQYESYHELAYLHPRRFQPDPSILAEMGLVPDDVFSVLRFVSFQASHDIGQKGLSLEGKRELIHQLSKVGRVIISSEQELPEEFEPYRLPIDPHKIHDVLAFANIFVGDSQSMTIEAAILGTPAIRCNTFVGRTPVIEELENEYSLTYGYLPEQESEMLAQVAELLSLPNLKDVWRKRIDKLLIDKIDLTHWMVEFVETVYQRS